MESPAEPATSSAQTKAPEGILVHKRDDASKTYFIPLKSIKTYEVVIQSSSQHRNLADKM